MLTFFVNLLKLLCYVFLAHMFPDFTFLGNDGLFVLMCRKAVNQSINPDFTLFGIFWY